MKNGFLTFVIILFSLKNYSQGVGIGTSNPRSTLEVNGTCRVDSIKPSPNSKRVLVQDSATGDIGYISLDSFKSNSVTSLPTVYYVENDTMISTQSNAAVTRVTLTLPAGTYLISAYCEVYNSAYLFGAAVRFIDDNNLLADTQPWSDYEQFAGWSFTKKVAISSTTNYRLQWYSEDPPSSDAYIQHARISALKCQ